MTKLEVRILSDARARVAAGDLSGPAAKRVECEPVQHGQDPEGARVAYECLAVTSDLPSIDASPGGVIGHPFRAVIHFPTGRLTWCKVSGRPAEGGLTSRGAGQAPARLLPVADLRARGAREPSMSRSAGSSSGRRKS